MALHPSLRRAGKQTAQRSVLTRNERIKLLISKGAWDKDKSQVLGLPKVKVVRLKTAKKVKEKVDGDDKKAATPGSTSGTTTKK